MQLHSLLMACQSIFNKNLFAQLKGSELTMGHPRILDYLKEHNGENQKQIAVGCHIEPPTLTTILNGMEEKGIIERKTLNGNRRYFFQTMNCDPLQPFVFYARGGVRCSLTYFAREVYEWRRKRAFRAAVFWYPHRITISSMGKSVSHMRDLASDILQCKM